MKREKKLNLENKQQGRIVYPVAFVARAHVVWRRRPVSPTLSECGRDSIGRYAGGVLFLDDGVVERVRVGRVRCNHGRTHIHIHVQYTCVDIITSTHTHTHTSCGNK